MRGRIRTDMERKKNTEGDVLERQKCERRGREIRRDWWERRKMRGRVVSERNARDKEGRTGDRRLERGAIYTKYVSVLFNITLSEMSKVFFGMATAERTDAPLDAAGLKLRTCPSRCALANFFDKRIQKEHKLVSAAPHTECTLQRR